MNVSWVLGGFLLLGFIFGWRKGLFRIVSGVAGIIIGLYVAFSFNASMGGIIDKYTGFTYRTAEFLAKHIPLAKFAAALPFESKTKGLENFISAPHHTVAGLLLYIISFIALFFLTKLIFNLICKSLTKCLDHTLIGPVNHFLGGLLGVFFAALILGVSLISLSYLMGDWNLPGDNLGSLTHTINQSDLARYILDLF